MTGLAAWVSNSSCCSEGQAAHAKSPWLCPSQLDVEWRCSSDDSMNSGILKILHALSAHSSRKTFQCQSHNFTPTKGRGWTIWQWLETWCQFIPFVPFLLWLVDCKPFLWLYRTQHVLETPARLESPHTKSLSSPAKHRLSCNLSSGPLASPKVHSPEGRWDKVKLGTVMQVLPCSLYRSTEINQKQKYSLWLFLRVTSVSKTRGKHAKYVFSRIYFYLRFVCFLN